MAPTPNKRVLTGDTPTGALHLGHYVGSLENRLRMQDECECYFLIANVHALTTRADDTDGVRKDTIEIVKDWLAVGIDPRKSVCFLQSEVPAIAELTWFFAMLLGYGHLMKNPTVKDEIRVKGLGDSYSFGFLMYPVGQVADILAFRPSFVPVGEDQVPHIEMCRDLARRFNQHYKEVFPVPEAKIGRIARLTGTDGKNKMSKSLNNAIFLSDTKKQVEKKCGRVFTGRGTMDDPPVVEGNTVLEYLEVFVPPEDFASMRDAYARSEIGDGDLKKAAAAAINTLLDPIRERRAKLTDDDVMDVLRDGTRRANAVAEETLAQAKAAANFGFFDRTLKI